MNVFELVQDFFKQVSTYITFDYLLYGSVGLLLFMFVVTLIKTRYTYEVKLLYHISRLNRYFINNPYINDENLIVFNRKMKKVPKALRYRWQEFMLNRDKAPSDYMNTVSCIDQPSKSSSYSNATVAGGIYTIVIAFFSFIVGLSNMMAANETSTFNDVYYKIWLLPVVVVILGFLFVLFMRARYTSIVADLYYEFHEFERGINKACTTLPQFIDYEVLFTRREIKEGIPVLQEYLEKRALQEKIEQDEMALNAFSYEQFDFEEIGIENSLLLERAMRESEKYFKVKTDLSARLKSKETEMLNYQRGFDETTKEHERKAQALRETITQLNEQINNTTIKIEANYMKKRRDEEQQRLQQLEKEYELASTRFLKQQNELQSEVDSYRSEMERRKMLTQEAMMAEGKTYANKVYALIAQTVQEQSRPYLEQIEENKNALEATISELSQVVELRNNDIQNLNAELEKAEQEYRNKLAGLEAVKSLKDYLGSEEFKQSFKKGDKNEIDSDKKLEYEEKISALNIDINEKENEVKKLSKEKDKLLEQVNTLFEENQSLKEKLEVIKKTNQEKIEVSNKESVKGLMDVLSHATTSKEVEAKPKKDNTFEEELKNKVLEDLKNDIKSEMNDIKDLSREVKKVDNKNSETENKEKLANVNLNDLEFDYNSDEAKTDEKLKENDEDDSDDDNNSDGGSEQADSKNKKSKKLKRVKSKLEKLDLEKEKAVKEKAIKESKQKPAKIKPIKEKPVKEKALKPDKKKSGLEKGNISLSEANELDDLKNLIKNESDKLAAQKNEFDTTIKQTMDALDTFESDMEKTTLLNNGLSKDKDVSVEINSTKDSNDKNIEDQSKAELGLKVNTAKADEVAIKPRTTKIRQSLSALLEAADKLEDKNKKE